MGSFRRYADYVFLPANLFGFLLIFLSLLLPSWSVDESGVAPKMGFLFFYCQTSYSDCTQLDMYNAPGWLQVCRALIMISAISIILCILMTTFVLMKLFTPVFMKIAIVVDFIGIITGFLALIIFLAVRMNLCTHCKPGDAWALGLFGVIFCILACVSRLFVKQRYDDGDDEVEYDSQTKNTFFDEPNPMYEQQQQQAYYQPPPQPQVYASGPGSYSGGGGGGYAPPQPAAGSYYGSQF